MATKTKKSYVIVRGTLAEHAGVLFMMGADDYRIEPRGEYEVVTTGSADRRNSPVLDHGRGFFWFRGDDGKNYRIFSDWQARVQK